MPSDIDPKSLEHQLRREAQEFFSSHGRQGSAAALESEHRRRARSRRVRIAGVATAAVAVLFAAIVAIESPEQETPGAPDLAGSSPARTPAVVQEQPPAPHLAEAPDSGDLVESLEPIPFLLTGLDAEGRPMIAVGVYIPPQVERVNLHDLPPLEQAAVRRMLEIEEEEVKPTI